MICSTFLSFRHGIRHPSIAGLYFSLVLVLGLGVVCLLFLEVRRLCKECAWRM